MTIGLEAGKAPLLRLALCLIAGIIVNDSVPSLPVPLLPLFVAVIILALLVWRHECCQSVAIAISFFILGMLLTERQRNAQYVTWPSSEMTFEAIVLSAPTEKPKTMAVDILLTDNQRKLKCYLSKDERSRALRVGDGLLIHSLIRGNSDWRKGHFDYRSYLEVHGFTGSTYVSRGMWQKHRVSLKNLSCLERTKLYFLKQRIRLLQRLQRHGLTDDSYAVVAAMALGDKSALSQELKEVYSQTGASHVLALSGLHLGIIYSLLSLLVVGRRWRAVSQLLIILSIWAFVFLVGMSVSVVRSAVMISVYALLALGHRDKMSVNTLCFTAIATLMISPNALFDVGFQMSYMSVFAILVFMPLFNGIFSQKYLLQHQAVKYLWGVASVSVSAQLGVAPLIAYYFGRFSTYFLFTNLIVIPAAALILYLFLAVLIFPTLSFLLASMVGCLNRLLAYIASLPSSSIDGLYPSALQVCLVYVVIGSIYLLATYIHRISPKRE